MGGECLLPELIAEETIINRPADNRRSTSPSKNETGPYEILGTKAPKNPDTLAVRKVLLPYPREDVDSHENRIVIICRDRREKRAAFAALRTFI